MNSIEKFLFTQNMEQIAYEFGITELDIEEAGSALQVDGKYFGETRYLGIFESVDYSDIRRQVMDRVAYMGIEGMLNAVKSDNDRRERGYDSYSGLAGALREVRGLLLYAGVVNISDKWKSVMTDSFIPRGVGE